MTHPSQGTVTKLLEALRGGEQTALDQLIPLVYEELQAIAVRERKKWRGDYTLNTTALVHEAYLKLVHQKQLNIENRAHFYRLAARAMRQILINYANYRRREKRGGNHEKLSLEEMKTALKDATITPEAHADMLLALNEALKKLSLNAEHLVDVVECRFFAGMTIAETAVALGISTSKVSRDWNLAKAWLYRALEDSYHA